MKPSFTGLSVAALALYESCFIAEYKPSHEEDWLAGLARTEIPLSIHICNPPNIDTLRTLGRCRLDGISIPTVLLSKQKGEPEQYALQH